MSPSAPRRVERLTPALGWRYGFLGLPLAFLALPLYVHLPHYYASAFGLSLTLIGSILLWTRGLDALVDPWLGRYIDSQFSKASTPKRRWHLAILSLVFAALLLFGFALLWWPQPQALVCALSMLGGTISAPSALLVCLIAGLVLSYFAYSVLAILHQAWGARMGGDAHVRSRVAAWREGFALAGVVLASILATGQNMLWAFCVLGLSLGASLWTLWRSVALADVFALPQSTATKSARFANTLSAQMGSAWGVWRNASFRKLMAVFVLNGIASAIPATLLPFYVADALQASEKLPVFLLLYFLCAALSIPAWLRVLSSWSARTIPFTARPQSRLSLDPLAALWLVGMLLSVAAFVVVLSLGKGAVLGFALVCMLTGLALGADLAMPSALLTGLIQKAGHAGSAEGQYYGWWSCANKLNLAFAAGIGLPLLELFGYQTGSTDAAALQALALCYVALPCLLKAGAALLLFQFGQTPTMPIKTATHTPSHIHDSTPSTPS